MNALRRFGGKLRKRASSPFWDGFWSVFYIPAFPDPPRMPAPPLRIGGGFAADSEALAEDWNRVGDAMWKAVGQFERENPEISRGFAETAGRGR